MMIITILLVVAAVTALLAVESPFFVLSLYALAVSGCLVAFILLLAGAAVPALLQLVSLMIVIYLIYRIILPKVKPEKMSFPGWLPLLAYLIFVVLGLFLAYELIGIMPPAQISVKVDLSELAIGLVAVLAAAVGAVVILTKKTGEG